MQLEKKGPWGSSSASLGTVRIRIEEGRGTLLLRSEERNQVQEAVSSHDRHVSGCGKEETQRGTATQTTGKKKKGKDADQVLISRGLGGAGGGPVNGMEQYTERRKGRWSRSSHNKNTMKSQPPQVQRALPFQDQDKKEAARKKNYVCEQAVADSTPSEHFYRCPAKKGRNTKASLTQQEGDKSKG